MRIGILGTGSVGGNLGRALSVKGHQITYGSRNPSSPKVQDLLALTGNEATATSPADAVAAGEIVIIALPSQHVADTVSAIDGWEGKIVVDATNSFAPSNSGLSWAEDIALLLPGAHVIKAFNTIGAEHYLNPVVDGQVASMFICGDDTAAKSEVGQLVTDIGFDLVDAGSLANAAYVESIAKLWIYLMRAGHGRNIAFKLLEE